MVILGINIFSSFNKWLKYKYDCLDNERYKIDTGIDISDNIDKLLDNLIESCFQEYSISNLIYKSDWYIKEEDEIKINKDICHLVGDRISETMLKQLSLYYNEDAIIDIISKRVYFKVTSFVIDHNKGTGL